MRPKMLGELPLFGKNVWRICCLSGQLLALLLPTDYVKTREMPWRLPKVLLSIWTFWVSPGRKSLSQTPRGRLFSALTVFSDQNFLQSWGHIRHFWSWYPLLRRSVFLEWVVSMLIGKRNWEIYWLNQLFFFNSDVILIGTSILSNL